MINQHEFKSDKSTKVPFKCLIKEVGPTGRKSIADVTVHETFSWKEAKQFMYGINKNLSKALVYVQFQPVYGI